MNDFSKFPNPCNLLSNFLHPRPPYWIRHFEFMNFVLGFVISDPKNLPVPNFKPIQSEEKCAFQRFKFTPIFDILISMPVLHTQITARNLPFWGVSIIQLFEAAANATICSQKPIKLASKSTKIFFISFISCRVMHFSRSSYFTRIFR